MNRSASAEPPLSLPSDASASSTFQQGDIAQLILQKDGLEILDEMLQPAREH